jgi:DNA polymerase/3'-5' exonuclease PolX
MGLYNKIEEKLNNQFSIFQLMTVLGIGASDVRLARNLLKQFHQQGYVKRISKNMYKKMENIQKSKQSDILKKGNIPKSQIKKKQLNKNLIPLTKLHRLGSKTEQKFSALGVNSVNDLIKEDASDLAKLISGVSEDSIKEWIEEGKNLLGE